VRRKHNRTDSLSVLSQIDQFIVKPTSKVLERREPHMYPTSASFIDSTGKVNGKCLRQAVFSYYGIPETNPPDAQAQYTFALGNAIEGLVGDWLKQMGLFVAHHVKFYRPDCNLSGEIDFVIYPYRKADTLIGLECKSFYGNYTKSSCVTGTKTTTAQPKIEHIMQVAMYLDNISMLEEFRLIYIGRDTFDRQEYTIYLQENGESAYPVVVGPGAITTEYKEMTMDRIYSRYQQAMDHIRANKLPAVDYKPEMSLVEATQAASEMPGGKSKLEKFKDGEILTLDWQCRYCNHRSLCRGLSRDVIEKFPVRYAAGEFKPKQYDASMADRNKP